MRAETTPTDDSKPTDAGPLIEEITEGLRRTTQEVVPWFIEQMPPMYFQDTDPATQLSHLRAIIAAKASNRPIEQTLRSEDGSRWTSLRPLDHPGVLAELLRELPTDRKLRAAKIHTAADGSLVLDTFEFGEAPAFDPGDPAQAARLEQTIAYAAEHLEHWTPEAITSYLNAATGEYVLTCSPLRLCKHWELFNEVTGTEGAAVRVEPETGDPTMCRIVVAVGNATTRTMIERIATRLSRSRINVFRAYLDVIKDGDNGAITLLGFVVQGPGGGPLDPESELWNEVRRDLLRIKWFDTRSLEFAYRNDGIKLANAEVIIALCDLAHQVLLVRNPYAFSPDRIAHLAERHIDITADIARLFVKRFDPDGPMDDAAFDAALGELRQRIDRAVELDDAGTVLRTLTDAVQAVLRTNYFLVHRYSIAMRLDPAFLQTEGRSDLPFGVFFVHGRAYNGFHVRFRNIARGGVRAVVPRGFDEHALEIERLYDEAYNLAHAQQLKNKDIPEGGSKAAVLIAPGSRVDRAVKGFVDGILDLITPDQETRSRIVDRFGQEELLYLGPDENITPELIEWIVDRARRRGYLVPNALMSSKPGAGINHKEYGVTSEGVQVFLDVTLRSVGIDPNTQPFSVKITGGPDGDVAGNIIRILQREYGGNANVVGIADGSGSAEDPDGLDDAELMRLVEASLPIAEFDRGKLGARGQVVAIDEPNGARLRNTLHNRVIADAFVPCGGRPNTINHTNWREFLTPDARPSSRVIVEGANLFLTPRARKSLSEAGAVIVKDSSANKCGVICSSYEIVASMLLDETEFLEIKERFVEEVLGKLRALARREAELLNRMHDYQPHVPLPDLSIRLSHAVMRTADAIEAALAEYGDDVDELLRYLIIEHLPPVLVERADARLWDATPRPYLKWIVAKALATRIAYREGFEHLETMPANAIADLAMRYVQLELERSRLIKEVVGSNLEHRDRIAKLLGQAGILSTLE